MVDSNYSLSDIAAATGNNNNNGGLFGGNNAIWIIILFLFAFMGWGGGWGGRGGYGGMDSGAVNNYVLTSDFSQLSRQMADTYNMTERKLDGISNGICDSTYALNNAITGGFAAAQNTMTQGFSGINTGMVQQGYETRLGIQNIGTQMGQCCCDLKGGIADLKYTVAQGDANTGAAISMAARDIVDNNNANFRALHDEITQNRIEDKNAQIQMLQQQLFQQQLAASQAEQSALLINQLKPCPIPSYVVPNPNCCYQNTTYANSGCGCA